jgi:hypothetical protein
LDAAVELFDLEDLDTAKARFDKLRTSIGCPDRPLMPVAVPVEQRNDAKVGEA